MPRCLRTANRKQQSSDDDSDERFGSPVGRLSTHLKKLEDLMNYKASPETRFLNLFKPRESFNIRHSLVKAALNLDAAEKPASPSKDGKNAKSNKLGKITCASTPLLNRHVSMFSQSEVSDISIQHNGSIHQKSVQSGNDIILIESTDDGSTQRHCDPNEVAINDVNNKKHVVATSSNRSTCSQKNVATQMQAQDLEGSASRKSSKKTYDTSVSKGGVTQRSSGAKKSAVHQESLRRSLLQRISKTPQTLTRETTPKELSAAQKMARSMFRKKPGEHSDSSSGSEAMDYASKNHLLFESLKKDNTIPSSFSDGESNYHNFIDNNHRPWRVDDDLSNFRSKDSVDACFEKLLPKNNHDAKSKQLSAKKRKKSIYTRANTNKQVTMESPTTLKESSKVTLAPKNLFKDKDMTTTASDDDVFDSPPKPTNESSKKQVNNKSSKEAAKKNPSDSANHMTYSLRCRSIKESKEVESKKLPKGDKNNSIRPTSKTLEPTPVTPTKRKQKDDVVSPLKKLRTRLNHANVNTVDKSRNQPDVIEETLNSTNNQEPIKIFPAPTSSMKQNATINRSPSPSIETQENATDDQSSIEQQKNATNNEPSVHQKENTINKQSSAEQEENRSSVDTTINPPFVEIDTQKDATINQSSAETHQNVTTSEPPIEEEPPQTSTPESSTPNIKVVQNVTVSGPSSNLHNNGECKSKTTKNDSSNVEITEREEVPSNQSKRDDVETEVVSSTVSNDESNLQCEGTSAVASLTETVLGKKRGRPKKNTSTVTPAVDGPFKVPTGRPRKRINRVIPDISTTNIIELENSQMGIRKSTRTRRPPKRVYQCNFVIIESPPKQSKPKKRKEQEKKKVPLPQEATITSNTNEEEDNGSNNVQFKNVLQVTVDNNETISMKFVDSLEKVKRSGNEPVAVQDVIVNDKDKVEMGYITVKARSSKPLEVSKNSSLYCTILKGSGEIMVDDGMSKVSEKSNSIFVVPSGSEYLINNTNYSSDLTISFVRVLCP